MKAISEEFDGIWFCNDCDKTFIFGKDVDYHSSKTGHNIKSQK